MGDSYAIRADPFPFPNRTASKRAPKPTRKVGAEWDVDQADVIKAVAEVSALRTGRLEKQAWVDHAISGTLITEFTFGAPLGTVITQRAHAGDSVLISVFDPTSGQIFDPATGVVSGLGFGNVPFRTIAVPSVEVGDPAQSLLADAASPRYRRNPPGGGVLSIDVGSGAREYHNSGSMTFAIGGFAFVFASILLLLLNVGAGLAGMFLGMAAFAIGNYAAYRQGDDDFILRPAVASRIFLGSLLLAVTALVAAVAN